MTIIEAIQPLTITARNRGPRTLAPGETIELPLHAAHQLLERGKGRVRVAPKYWLSRYREIAQITDGFEESHPKVSQIKRVIPLLDKAYFAEDVMEFEKHVAELKVIAQSKF